MKKIISTLALIGTMLASPVLALEPNYVDCILGSDSSNGSTSTPWRTIGYALNNVNSSRIIRINGLCRERVVLPPNITLENVLGTMPAIIDGKDVGIYPAVFEIWGQHDITFKNIKIKNSSNIPGNTVKGINVLSGKGPDGIWQTADDVGAYNIKIDGVTFADINRSSSTIAYSLPLLVSSWGNSQDSLGTAANHISITNNRFEESDTNSATINQPLIQIVDNVQDFEIRDNYFKDKDVGAAIQLSGNRSTSAKPNRPTKGVIINNVSEQMGQSGVWITAAQKILIQDNFFVSSSRGVNVYTENQGLYGDFDIAKQIWVRKNTFKDLTYQALATGAIWSSEYCDVADVYFTNNYIMNKSKPNGSEAISLYGDHARDAGETESCLTTCGQVTGECGDLIGDSKIVNNIVYSDTPTHTNARLLLSAVDFNAEPGVVINKNFWGAPSTSLPFVNGGTFLDFNGWRAVSGQGALDRYRDWTSDYSFTPSFAWFRLNREPKPTWLVGQDFFGAYTPVEINNL